MWRSLLVNDKWLDSVQCSGLPLRIDILTVCIRHAVDGAAVLACCRRISDMSKHWACAANVQCGQCSEVMTAAAVQGGKLHLDEGQRVNAYVQQRTAAQLPLV